MALSRLQHPLKVISRAPSLLLRARLLSSVASRSLFRSPHLQNFLLGGHGSLLRPASLFMLTGVHENSLKLKPWVGGVKHFSSTDLS